METDPEWIIDDAGANCRGLTFSLAPMKWLGQEAAHRSLLPLAHLAEDLLGWRRKRVPYQAGQGLGAWLKWLRANANTLTLRQVRERLAGVAEEVALEALPGAAYSGGTAEQRQTPALTIRPVRLKKSSSKEPWLMIASLAMLAVAAAWWLFQYQVAHKAATAEAAAGPPVAAANTRVVQTVAPTAAVADTGQQQPGDSARHFDAVPEKTVRDNRAGGADRLVTKQNRLLGRECANAVMVNDLNDFHFVRSLHRLREFIVVHQNQFAGDRLQKIRFGQNADGLALAIQNGENQEAGGGCFIAHGGERRVFPETEELLI